MRLSKQSYKYKKRVKLHAQNPYCHWCNTLTILNPKGVELDTKKFPNLATLDHLYSRINHYRKIPCKNNEIRIVLACYKCNNKRGTTEYNSLPIEERRKRSEQQIQFQKLLESLNG